MGVVLLVRHGQASFGAADYDRLSSLGEAQALLVGQFLRASGLTPSRVVSGSMRRQLDTASGACREAGWKGEIDVHPGWDEYDHVALVGAGGRGPAAVSDQQAYQADLDDSLARWADGWTPEGGEGFTQFTARVEDRLRDVAREQSGVTVVFTSAGVIAWLGAALVGGGAQQWIHLNRVVVNGSLTRVTSGRRGLSLVTFNEHSHIPPDSRTYR